MQRFRPIGDAIGIMGAVLVRLGRILFAFMVLATLWLGLRRGWQIRSDVGKGFVNIGGDSKFYIEGAGELYRSGSLGTADNPRTCRPPGYSWFLVEVGRRVGVAPGYDGRFTDGLKDRQYAIDLATAVVAGLVALFLGGWLAAALAFLALIHHPIPLSFPPAVLSETVAMFAFTCATLLVVHAAERRTRVTVALAALGIGLAMMVRTDALLLLPALVVALWRRGEGWRPLGRRTALALAVALALPAAWTARNYFRADRLLFTTELCDNAGRPIYHGHFMRWMRTWLSEESQLPSTLWPAESPWRHSGTAGYPREAFDSPAEQAEVQRLFDLNTKEFFSERVDEGFAALAHARVRRHPLRNFVVLPATRLWNLINSRVHFIKVTLPGDLEKSRQYFHPLLVVPRLLGFIGLLALVWRRRPYTALALAVLWWTRVAGLAWAGYVEGRYLLEVLPLELALAATALAAPVEWLILRARRRASPTRPSSSAADARSSPSH
jgi:hypothetical protein